MKSSWFLQLHRSWINIIKEVKQVFFVIKNIKIFQKGNIFFLECFLSMMFFLILYVFAYMIWSLTPFIASILLLLFWTMPVMYLYKSFFHSFRIKLCLYLTANTNWMYICVNVFGIYAVFVRLLRSRENLICLFL